MIPICFESEAKSMKVIKYRNMEEMYRKTKTLTWAFYDGKTDAIHILCKEALYEEVFEHEYHHYLRDAKGGIICRIISFLYEGKYMTNVFFITTWILIFIDLFIPVIEFKLGILLVISLWLLMKVVRWYEETFQDYRRWRRKFKFNLAIELLKETFG